MQLVRLVYCSSMAPECDIEDIESILAASRENNPTREITGLLFWGSAYFLQCLEGRRTQVNKLYHKICHDPRHTHVIILEYSDIEERLFSDWSMAYISTSGLDEEMLGQLPNNGAFDPYLLKAEEARAVIESLAQMGSLQ